MREYQLIRSQRLPLPLARVFSFFAEPRNLARITPPGLGFRIVTTGELIMTPGLTIEYRISPLLVPQRWVSEITVYEPPHRFVDEQRVGPYRKWHHLHEFEAVAGGTEIRDVVTYALPFGPLGSLAHALLVRRQLEGIFACRSRVVEGMIEREGRGAP
ncbi:MAG TPA: SRPBCC family protein [Gemmatimonadales bacterium]|nr:SRPBCC family protein [Gemmatimonadales bacterium]